MLVVRTILTVVFLVACIVMVIAVLLQEGKQQGLGALAGTIQSDTYWSKNKGRTMEGVLVKVTRFLTIAFLAVAAVLNIGSFA